MAFLLVAACDGLVGLTPPEQGDASKSDGSARTDASDGAVDASPADALLDTDAPISPSDGGVDAESGPDAPPPLAEWKLSQTGAVSAIAIAGNGLYVIENRDVYRTTLTDPPPLRQPSTVWSSPIGSTALAAWGGTLYVGAGPQIVAIDGDGGATVVFDLWACGMAGMPTPILGLATDGMSLFWTHANPNFALSRHDLGSAVCSHTDLLTESSSRLGPVAVDMINAYTVVLDTPMTSDGELAQVPKNATVVDPLPVVPSGARGTAPLVSPQNTEVYFVAESDAGGRLALASMGSGAVVQFKSASVDTYAIDLDKGWLFVGSGRSLLYTPLGQDSPRLLVATASSTPIGGIAVGSGYVAYFSQDVLGVVAEP
jgi:hypothetical protein